MARHPGGERFEIVLRAAPDDVPPAVRLRQWLKGALRAARMRAVSVRETTPRPAGPPQPAQETAGRTETADAPARTTNAAAGQLDAPAGMGNAPQAV